ncbi:MAG TPA: zinc-binding dehydrogenase [Solirubrobacteraceae bacterium]
MSATMRAIQMSEFGGPEVLKLVELPIPEPGDDEVLIEVARAGLNFADTHTRTNSYVRKATLPLVPGGEVAGTIVRAPAGSERAVGERVVALTGTGGYAQYATAPAAHVFPVPKGVDEGTALALILQGTTAWHLYRTSGRVAAGESVVVHSAAGGVGSLAVQLGHALGAGRVIGTASSAKRRELVLSLGADAAVDPAPEGLTERLIEANGGEPVDVVFDMAGGATFDASYEALAHFGRIVVCGISGEEPNRVSTGSLLRHSRAAVGFYLFHCLQRPEMFGEALADLFTRVQRGELRAVIGGTYPLAEAARAQIDILERRTSGKLLLDPSA